VNAGPVPAGPGARPEPSRRKGCLLVAALLTAMVAAALALLLPKIPTTRKLLQSHRVEAEVQLAAIEVLARGLSAVPKVDPDGPLGETVAAGAFGPLSQENTAVFHTEDLADLSAEAKELPVRVVDPYRVTTPAALVRRGCWPDGKQLAPLFFDYDNVRERLEMLQRLKYMLVVRTLILTEPTMVDDHQYNLGYYSAEVLVFEIPGGRYLGGFTFSTWNSFSVINGTPLGDLESKAEYKFRTEVTDRWPEFFGKPWSEKRAGR